MDSEGIGRALLATVREWVAGLGAAGALLAAVFLAAMARLSSVPAIAGLAAGLLGVTAGVVGFRRGGLLGALLAVASVGLALVAFALLAVAPERSGW